MSKISEHGARKNVDHLAFNRLDDTLLALIPHALGIRPRDLVLNERVRQLRLVRNLLHRRWAIDLSVLDLVMTASAIQTKTKIFSPWLSGIASCHQLRNGLQTIK